MSEFKQKTIIITGGNSGLGKAIAEKLAGEGGNLILAARNEEKGQKLAESIRQSGGCCQFIRCDITNSVDVEKLIQTARDTYGSVDYAVNNAGTIGESKLITRYSEEEWDRVTTTNIRGTFLSLKYEITEMLKNTTGGAIVNVASIYGLVGSPFGATPYSASKHAIVGMTKSAALEFAAKNIRINAICPGAIETEMLTGVFEGVKDPDQAAAGFKALHPMGRFSTAEEIADSVIWLLSKDSAFITGTAIAADGGYTAQ